MQTNRSSRAFLVAAVALGVLATVAAFVYLNQTAGQDRGPTLKILVARHDLQPKKPIDPEKDLDEWEIPVRFADLKSRALTPEVKMGLKGQRVNRRVLAGQPLLQVDLTTYSDLELKGDARALSIPVRGANALSGLVVPGDYVRVMVTRPVVKNRIGSILSRPATRSTAPPSTEEGDEPSSGADIAIQWQTQAVSDQPFKVLAVGPSLSRSRQQITAADAYESMSHMESQQTVTLEVTEAQAKQILEMSGAGQLPVTLVLCPPPGK